jgi:hypothetical protein
VVGEGNGVLWILKWLCLCKRIDSMVDGNNVYILESMFNGRNGYLKGIMERFYGGDVGCDSDTSSDYNNRCNILASSTNII